MKKFFVFSVLIPLALVSEGAIVRANLSDFTHTLGFESFEGPVNWDNAQYDRYGQPAPGMNSAYTFPSGVSLVYPIPNGILPTDSSVAICNGDLGFGMRSYGFLDPENIPHGSNYLMSTGNGFGAFQLAFPNQTKAVGGNFMMSGTNPGLDAIELDFYNPTNQWLGSALVPATDASLWKDSFIAFKDSNGEDIAKMTAVAWPGPYGNLPASHPAIDGLAFDYIAPVPEPATIVGLASAGAIGIGILLFNRRRKKSQNPPEDKYFDE